MCIRVCVCVCVRARIVARARPTVANNVLSRMLAIKDER